MSKNNDYLGTVTGVTMAAAVVGWGLALRFRIGQKRAEQELTNDIRVLEGRVKEPLHLEKR